jgi:prepilin-type N-terminal cleavage/methylation domain-containing protein
MKQQRESKAGTDLGPPFAIMGGPRPVLTKGGPAFTLIELLCVLAVVGILAALILPGTGSARRSANKAKTKVQFAQWAAAIESFRGEYGHYPSFDPSNMVNGGVTGPDHLFHDLLAGRRRDGTAPAMAGPAAAQNRKLVRFHSFADGDFTPAGLLRDAFDNTAIAVLVDRDLDGLVRPGSDFTALPAVAGITPTPGDIPASGIRAGVILYAPAPGANPANPEFIFSWK